MNNIGKFSGSFLHGKKASKELDDKLLRMKQVVKSLKMEAELCVQRVVKGVEDGLYLPANLLIF